MIRMDDEHKLTSDNMDAIRYGSDRGIRCPQCHCRDFYTYRTERMGEFIRRTKICRHCGARIHTQETYVRHLP